MWCSPRQRRRVRKRGKKRARYLLKAKKKKDARKSVGGPASVEKWRRKPTKELRKSAVQEGRGQHSSAKVAAGGFRVENWVGKAR